ncbi:MAG TPA: NADH-quinone oxidoreductase subunit C [Candidatus Obscuribacterales bacterium]
MSGQSYPSLTRLIPQAHWFERTVWDMFGLFPEGHPRLKHTHLHETYGCMPYPLAEGSAPPSDRAYKFLEVEGDGVYEIPVGPIHAGIIEPGHFRFSCYGEVIVNLEIRLGYVHRGVEKRLTEIPWAKTRFVAEATASDMAAANALANATALESFFDVEIPRRALLLRTAAAEVERVAMHICDLGGLSTDVGFLGIASSMSRLRGIALAMSDLLSGNRFLRGFICPGGVTRSVEKESIDEIRKAIIRLKEELNPVVELYLDNQVAVDRMDGIGRISRKLACDFGLVGVAARGCGLPNDCRKYSSYATFPNRDLPIAVEDSGDILARAKVRIAEIATSLDLLDLCLQEVADTTAVSRVQLPSQLPAGRSSLAIVESHRGELIHLVTTDDAGLINRYCIKDPSVNNWTGVAIAVRSHVVADFPLCNKSFSLSYSGHDL